MIYIQPGKMIIPEEERFVGFAGDNLSSSKTFVVRNGETEDCVFKLFLTFDDATCNYFELEQIRVGEAMGLIWNIREEHLFKSGIVSAQIKVYEPSGEIWHTSEDFFVVDDSAEFAEFFHDKKNSEFLAYERRLIALKAEIESILDKLPYFGTDGYWYLFDKTTDSFIRADFALSYAMSRAFDVPSSGNMLNFGEENGASENSGAVPL